MVESPGSSEPRGAPPGVRRALGRRGAVVLVGLLGGALAWGALELSFGQLAPKGGGRAIAADFLGAALSPAFDYEAASAPAGAPAFLVRLAMAVYRTLVFAAAAMSLALVAGGLLGAAASDTWWRREPKGSGLRAFGRCVHASPRLLIAAMRSVHELLWAVVFLAAFGLNTAAAVIALAIPFAGVLAKVFSEILDEAPPAEADALRAAGARPVQAFLVATLPRAAPDVAAYAFYRFECAVRSSAVLGFFGYETLGYYLKLSFENLHYREVWAYLYALIALVLALEAWSSGLRRRFVV